MSKASASFAPESHAETGSGAVDSKAGGEEGYVRALPPRQPHLAHSVGSLTRTCPPVHAHAAAGRAAGSRRDGPGPGPALAAQVLKVESPLAGIEVLRATSRSKLRVSRTLQALQALRTGSEACLLRTGRAPGLDSHIAIGACRTSAPPS